MATTSKTHWSHDGSAILILFGRSVIFLTIIAIIGASWMMMIHGSSFMVLAYISFISIGCLLASETILISDSTDSNSNLYIWSKIFNRILLVWEIDDIGIYGRAIFLEQILTLYHEGMNTLSLSAFLEGPYNGTDMNTNLNPEPIPLSQPYNDLLKWDYQGTESVAAIPNADVVDWVLVELRETSGDASTALPDSMISQQAAFILKDGSIVGLDGSKPTLF